LLITFVSAIASFPGAPCPSIGQRPGTAGNTDVTPFTVCPSGHFQVLAICCMVEGAGTGLARASFEEAALCLWCFDLTTFVLRFLPASKHMGSDPSSLQILRLGEDVREAVYPAGLDA